MCVCVCSLVFSQRLHFLISFFPPTFGGSGVLSKKSPKEEEEGGNSPLLHGGERGLCVPLLL